MTVHPKPDLPLNVIYWQNRLFKNTYSYRGKLHQVKGWSVKIQYQGRRKTFTFPGASKTEAAQKALLVYKTVRSRGWKALDDGDPPLVNAASSEAPAVGTRMELSLSDAQYWESRLIQRKYPPLSDGFPKITLSAKIEHAGQTSWFPLGTNVPKEATARALEIYRAAVLQGWNFVNKKFSREITLAVHWAANPLAWTYTTFHTHTGSQDRVESIESRKPAPAFNVAIIEPEEGIRNALVHWISQQPGVACSGAYSSADEVVGNVHTKDNALWLVNRSLPEQDGTDFIREINAQSPQSCGLFYSTYEDSEQLFATSPGGAVAYLFRRTAANRILEPLLGQLPAILPLSFKKVSNLARHYFYSSIAAALPAESVLQLGRLTPREHEILQLLSKGLLDKEIADRLRISIWTVHGHVKKIFRKLQVHSRTEAVVTYLQK